MLLLGLTLEDAECRKIVFHFLKSRKGGLAIRGYSAVIVCYRTFGRCTSTPGIKESLRQLPADRPHAARPHQPVCCRRTFKSCRRADRQRGVVCGACDSDLVVSLRHPAFASGDIGSTFKQAGRQADGDYREVKLCLW